MMQYHVCCWCEPYKMGADKAERTQAVPKAYRAIRDCEAMGSLTDTKTRQGAPLHSLAWQNSCRYLIRMHSGSRCCEVAVKPLLM